MIGDIRALLAFAVILAGAAITLAKDPAYCEAPLPLSIVPNPVTSTLQQVIVISRHGDRSPGSAIPHEHNDTRIVWNCSFVGPTRAFTTDKILTNPTFVLVVLRLFEMLFFSSWSLCVCVHSVASTSILMINLKACMATLNCGMATVSLASSLALVVRCALGWALVFVRFMLRSSISCHRL